MVHGRVNQTDSAASSAGVQVRDFLIQKVWATPTRPIAP